MGKNEQKKVAFFSCHLQMPLTYRQMLQSQNSFVEKLETILCRDSEKISVNRKVSVKLGTTVHFVRKTPITP
jgi:hypothetical protein